MIAITSFFRAILTFPLVLLTFSTPIRMTGTPNENIYSLIVLNLTVISITIVSAYCFFWDSFLYVVTSKIFLLCLTAILLPAFWVTLKQTYRREKGKNDIELEKIKNSPWRPYSGSVTGKIINIELNNNNILWHVPSEQLDVLHDEVKLWMPVQNRHTD